MLRPIVQAIHIALHSLFTIYFFHFSMCMRLLVARYKSLCMTSNVYFIYEWQIINILHN